MFEEYPSVFPQPATQPPTHLKVRHGGSGGRVQHCSAPCGAQHHKLIAVWGVRERRNAAGDPGRGGRPRSAAAGRVGSTHGAGGRADGDAALHEEQWRAKC